MDKIIQSLDAMDIYICLTVIIGAFIYMSIKILLNRKCKEKLNFVSGLNFTKQNIKNKEKEV